MAKEKRSHHGLDLQTKATRERSIAVEMDEHKFGEGNFHHIEAHRLEDEAQHYLEPMETPRLGPGGEALPAERLCTGIEGHETMHLRATLEKNSSQIHLDASLSRMEQARDAKVLDQALDASDSINAKNSLEKMLAHQLAALHDKAMMTFGKLDQEISVYSSSRCGKRDGAVELQRLANSGCRLVKTYQEGLLTLQKLRTGGQQVVTVQHVQVNEGGQAVVAGQVGGKPLEGG